MKFLVAAVVCAFLTAVPAWTQWTGGPGGPIYYDGGNVGIGTTSPAARLNVGTSGTSPGSGIGSFGVVTSGSYGGGIGLQDGPGNIGIWDDTYGANLHFGFGTNLGALAPTVTFTSSGNVGIGTTSPAEPLEVVGGTYVTGTLMTGAFPLASGAWSGTGILAASGSSAGMAFFNRSLSSFSANNAGDVFVWYDQNGSSAQLWTPSSGNIFTITNTGYVGIGTTNPVHPLQVAGAIGAEEVIVSSTGADYVFKSDYPLKPLTEVSAYIQANHHLPEVPSAAEMKQKGVNLGEMQTKLLAKIEELTLHMIQAEERNNRMEQENQALRHEIQQLEERLTQ